METISWPCLQQILRWIPEPVHQARLARTCHSLYNIINEHAEDLAVAFLLAAPRPLSAACYYGRPLYLDICYRLGLEKIHTSEAFEAACRYGPEWVVDRLLASDELACCCELGLWAACVGGQLGTVKKMVSLGATMISTGLSRLDECRDREKRRDIFDYLWPLVGKTSPLGDRYF